MSVDAEAMLIIGWIVDESTVDDEIVAPWLDDMETEDIRSIIGDGHACDWVGYTNSYSCDELYIGILISIYDYQGGRRSSLSAQEIYEQMSCQESLDKAKRVYEAVCGKAPDTDPQAEIFARWC